MFNDLNDDNVVYLNYLANIYEVSSLINDTSSYMEEHEDLSLQTILLNQNIENFDLSSYETIITKYLLDYIDDERLLSINFPILFRIVSEFIKQNGSKEIIDFLFEAVNHYGKDASILFQVIDFQDLSDEDLNKLLSKTPEQFDFNYVNLYLFQFMKEKMEQQQTQNDKYIKKIKDDHSQELLKLNSQINKLKEDNSNLLKESREFKKQIACNEQKIRELQNENVELRAKIEQGSQNNSKSDEDNENIEEIIKIQKFVPNEESQLDGIFKSLSDKTDKNIVENGIINVSSNSIFQESYSPENLLYDDDQTYASKKSDADIYVVFDFINMEIEISNYSIKSCNCKKDLSHIKNWKIEISNDGNNWEMIDEHSDYADLNGPNIIKMFSVKPNHFARYCRFHHQGNYWGIDKSMLEINAIEFFGRIKTRTSQ